jgi:hypothetical protein
MAGSVGELIVRVVIFLMILLRLCLTKGIGESRFGS